MASTDTPVGSVAALLQAVQAQTDTVKNFKDEQINVFTTTQPTATVTDADGNPVTIPSWAAIVQEAHPSPGSGSAAVPPGLVQSLPNQLNSFLMPMGLVGYGFRDQMTANAAIFTQDAAVDNTGAVVSTSLTASQLTYNANALKNDLPAMASLFKMGGRVPAYGKWFFSLQAPIASGTTSNAAEINIALNPWQYQSYNFMDMPTANQANLSDVAGQLEILANLLFTSTNLSINGNLVVGEGAAGDYLTHDYGTNKVAWTADPYNVLVCMDVDNSAITVYNTTGLIGTIQVPKYDSGVSMLAGAYITGKLWALASNFSLTFNTTAANSPFAVPSGFGSLIQAIGWNELANSDLQDHVEFSNPFFSHVWLGPNGELLGGISSVTNQPWFQRGGFIAQDVAILKNAVGYMNLPSMNQDGLSETAETWSPSTAQRHVTTGGYQTQRMAVGHATAANVSAGTRSSDGGFEVYGLDVAKFMIDQINAKTKSCNWFVVGDGMVLSDMANVGSAPYGSRTFIYNAMSSTEFATAVGALGLLITTSNRAVDGSYGGASNSQMIQSSVPGAQLWNLAPQTVVTGMYGLTDAGSVEAISPIYNATDGVAGYVTNATTTAANNTALYGWLGGIYGALYWDTVAGDANLNKPLFQPYYLNPSPVSIPDYSPFIVDTNPVLSPSLNATSSGIASSAYEDSIAVISVGRNNLSDLPTVKRDITAMVNKLKDPKRFVILSPINKPNEAGTSTNGLAVIALEQWLAFTYPSNCILTRQYLQNQGASDAATAITDGTTPVSYWLTDTSGNYTTLTSTAAALVTVSVNNFIVANNWQVAPTLSPVVSPLQ